MLFPDTKRTVTFKAGDSIQASTSTSAPDSKSQMAQPVDLGKY